MKTILMALILVNTTSLTNTQRAELRRIEERILAPCCYTQSISVHGSEIAGQMRTEVAEMVAERRTEEEIVDHYKNLYGDRILIVPDGVTGKILFTLPVVTVGLGLSSPVHVHPENAALREEEVIRARSTAVRHD